MISFSFSRSLYSDKRPTRAWKKYIICTDSQLYVEKMDKWMNVSTTMSKNSFILLLFFAEMQKYAQYLWHEIFYSLAQKIEVNWGHSSSFFFKKNMYSYNLDKGRKMPVISCSELSADIVLWLQQWVFLVRCSTEVNKARLQCMRVYACCHGSQSVPLWGANNW